MELRWTIPLRWQNTTGKSMTNEMHCPQSKCYKAASMMGRLLRHNVSSAFQLSLKTTVNQGPLHTCTHQSILPLNNYPKIAPAISGMMTAELAKHCKTYWPLVTICSLSWGASLSDCFQIPNPLQKGHRNGAMNGIRRAVVWYVVVEYIGNSIIELLWDTCCRSFGSF